LFGGEAAHGGEKAAADVFGGDAGEEVRVGGGVFGADRADDEGAVMEGEEFDAVGGIGADGEGDGGFAFGAQMDARTGGGDAGGGGEQRVDLDRGDVGPIDDELAHADQGGGEGVAVGEGEAAAQAEQVFSAGAGDEGLGEGEVEGQEFDGVVAAFGGVASAGAEADDRAEDWVGFDADREFAGGLDLRLDDE
jgi:hypothetical protein